MHPVFIAGMADAQPQPVKAVADMGLDRAQPIVPRIPAAGLDADFSGRQIERIASPTARPDSFMNVVGLTIRIFAASRTPSAVSDWNRAR